MKHIFIINPAAGKYDHSQQFRKQIEEACGARGLAYEICVSQKPGDCRDIARKAAEFIYDNETVFIDGSSTCLHMGQYLSAKKGLTVYTYAAELCAILAAHGINVYCLGGRYDKVSKVFTGEYAIKMIESIYFDAFFFSDSGFCDGIISDYNEAETHMRRALLAQSARKYFLCDSEAPSTCAIPRQKRKPPESGLSFRLIKTHKTLPPFQNVRSVFGILKLQSDFFFRLCRIVNRLQQALAFDNIFNITSCMLTRFAGVDKSSIFHFIHIGNIA